MIWGKPNKSAESAGHEVSYGPIHVPIYNCSSWAPFPFVMPTTAAQPKHSSGPERTFHGWEDLSVLPEGKEKVWRSAAENWLNFIKPEPYK